MKLAEHAVLLHEGNTTRLFLAHDEHTGGPIVVKALKQNHGSIDALRSLENEYDLTSSLDLPGVRKALSKGTFRGEEALFLEYVPATTVAEHFRMKPRGLHEILSIAIRTAQVLDALHNRNIVHKNICSETILIEIGTGAVKLIDFSFATRLQPLGQQYANRRAVRTALSTTGRICTHWA